MSYFKWRDVFGQDGSADGYLDGNVDLTLRLGFSSARNPQAVKVPHVAEANLERFNYGDVDVTLRLGNTFDGPVRPYHNQVSNWLKFGIEEDDRKDVDLTLRLGPNAHNKKFLCPECRKLWDKKEVEEQNAMAVKKPLFFSNFRW